MDPRQQAFRLIRFQWLSGVAGAIIGLCFGVGVAVSVFLGCFVVALPATWFAYRLFLSWRQVSAKRLVLRFYLGELFKMIFSGFLAIFFVNCFAVQVTALIVGMLVAYLAYALMAPRVMRTKQRGSG